MPPTVEDRLRDILDAIADIDEVLAELNLDQFSSDKIRRKAIERYLEVVCEAARKLPDEIKLGASNIDWRKMNDFANLAAPCLSLDQGRHRLGHRSNHLPPLKTFVELQMRERDK